MADTMRKVTMISLFEEETCQSYFENMARQGLHLHEFGAYAATFTRGEPAETCYRIAMLQRGQEQQLLERYVEHGWEVVYHRKQYALLRAPQGRIAPDSAEEAAQRERIYKRLRNERNNSYIMLFCLLINLFIITNFLLGWKSFIVSIIPLVIPMMALSTFAYLLGTLGSEPTVSLSAGLAAAARTRLSGSRYYAVLSDIRTLFHFSYRGYKPRLSDTTRNGATVSLPAVRLEFIETAPHLQRDESPYDDYDVNNCFALDYFPLVRRYLTIEKMVASAPGDAAEQDAYRPHIRNEYYRLSFAQLTGLLKEDLFDEFYDEQGFYYMRGYRVTEYEDPRCFVAVQGRSLLYVDYYGAAATEDIIDEIAKVLQLWQN